MNRDDLKIRLIVNIPMSISSLVIGALIYTTDCLGDLFCEVLKAVAYPILGCGVFATVISAIFLYMFFTFEEHETNLSISRDALHNFNKVSEK